MKQKIKILREENYKVMYIYAQSTTYFYIKIVIKYRIFFKQQRKKMIEFFFFAKKSSCMCLHMRIFINICMPTN